MTFFLLKWIFNAIKRDSQIEDPKLQGKPYVTKVDLIKQLGKNEELMRALGYNSQADISNAVKNSRCVKEGSLVWDEFLDFFFQRQANLQSKQGEGWWKKVNQEGHMEEITLL